MTKKDYMKPELQVMQVHTVQMFATSVLTTGLGDELSQDDENPNGDAWNDALGRRRRNRNVWEDEELEEEFEEFEF